ncbi:hypothetical protein PENSPDRAFT_58232 [Peniophora sp. CONT]|nr:hypothetical protein PENSPDRAFT_58232 [Peniophora sp. CONT]
MYVGAGKVRPRAGSSTCPVLECVSPRRSCACLPVAVLIVRCDGDQVPGNQCSTCVEYQLDCTYLEGTTAVPKILGTAEVFSRARARSEFVLEKETFARFGSRLRLAQRAAPPARATVIFRPDVRNA